MTVAITLVAVFRPEAFVLSVQRNLSFYDLTTKIL